MILGRPSSHSESFVIFDVCILLIMLLLIFKGSRFGFTVSGRANSEHFVWTGT